MGAIFDQTARKIIKKEQILTKKVSKWSTFSILRVRETFSILSVRDLNFTHCVVLEYALGSLSCDITYGYSSYCYIQQISSKVIPLFILSCLPFCLVYRI